VHKMAARGRLKKTSRYWMLARRPECRAAQQKVRRRGQPLTPLSRCHVVSRSTREDTGGQRACPRRRIDDPNLVDRCV
jgi:hypothetical protein